LLFTQTELTISQYKVRNWSQYNESLKKRGSRSLWISEDAIPKWKQSLWDNNSIEPAMLRVPIVLLAFVFLWGINVVILDKFKLPYQSVMSIKSGNV
jgi:hypothetical protein